MSTARIGSQGTVDRVLQQCRQQIYLNAVLSGLATIGIVLLTCALIAACLDLAFGLPSSIRAAMLAAIVGTVVWLTWRCVIIPLNRRVPAEQLGAAVDMATPSLNESLATLISIEGPDATSAEAGSEVMRRHLRSEVAGQLSQVNSRAVVDYRSTQRRCGTAGLLLMLSIVPFVFWPSASKLLMHRMMAPFSNLATVSNLYFEVPDGNRTVARGSTVRIEAVPGWRTGAADELPDVVEMKLIGSNGGTESLAMMFDEIGNRYVIDLPRIEDSIDFQITGNGATTETFSLHVVDAPAISAATMTATPPPYTGRAVEQFDGIIGQLEVFERSQLELRLEFNKPVHSAALVWMARDARPVTEAEMLEIEFDDLSGEDVMEIDMDAPLMAVTEPLETRVNGTLIENGTAAVFTMTADVGGDFEFEVLDEFQLPNTMEPERHLSVVYDKPPELNVSGLHDIDEFRPDDILPANCLVVDDIGIGDLELHYQRNDDVEKVIAANTFDRGITEARHAFRLKLEELELASGDTLIVRIRASDERPDPGPQETWSKPFSIRISDDAAPAGQRALNEDTQEMVDALKQMEELLNQDVDKAAELKQETKQGWTDQARTETQGLSEKEQQQGKILEKLADQVATHPLMKQSAEELQQLGQKLRVDIPEALDKAASEDRREAHTQLQNAEQQLIEAREKLHEQIQKIEAAAKLEQDLAELSRLALDANQLAQDAEQLEQDRDNIDNKPPELSEENWDEQLQQRQQELQQDQAELRNELNQLLQQKQNLLEAAQRSQREQLTELSDIARQLSERQQKLADDVDQESKEAANEASNLVRRIRQAKTDADKLNTAVPEDADVRQPETQKLEKAAEQLQNGDLASPEGEVSDVARDFTRMEQQLRKPPEQDPDDDANNDADAIAAEIQQRRQTADGSQKMADRLEGLREEIAKLRAKRIAEKAVAAQEAAEPSEPLANAFDSANSANSANSAEAAEAAEAKPMASNDNARQDLQRELEQLQQRAQEVADAVASDAQSTPKEQQAADAAAEQVQQAVEESAAGQFADAASEIRKAAQSAQQSASQSSQQAKSQPADTQSPQQERQRQAERLRDDANRMAQSLQQMSQDNAAQNAAQQQSQQNIAEQAAQLPQQLQELSERLNLDALQMQQQAQQAQQAQQSAQAAQTSSQQAASELQEGDLQQAGQSGQNTADKLQQLSEQAAAAGQQPGESSDAVPTEIGESIADALQDLAQAAQAMQQDSQQANAGESDQSAEQSAQGQPGQGQPAEGEQAAGSESGQPGQQAASGQQAQAGQPGQGQAGEGGEGQPGQSPGGKGQNSGSQQLSDAAQSLADAAQSTLPKKFNPGLIGEAGESSSAGEDGMGNAAMWNGLLPNAEAGPAGSRDWGKANQELETETKDGVAGTRDSEYEALIRMYFREVARASAGNTDP